MSDVVRAVFLSILVALGALAAGCASPNGARGEGDLGSSEAALGEAGTLTFTSDFHVRTTGVLEKGKAVRIDYDPSRLSACRGDFAGNPGWSITGYFRINAGVVRSFEAGGFSPSGGTQPPAVALDQSGDLEIWFQNTSRWGCSAYDSAFGKNYHFVVRPGESEPGWVGNVRSNISRQTCNGPCESDMHPLQGDLVYDTWSRQRAAIAAIYFEVWKDGVTTFDNPDLWKQIDVQVHSRIGSSGPFTASYVNLERRVGNNARYALDLSVLDPVKGLVAVTTASDCPVFPLKATADTAYVEADVEVYFTVNGVELRPSPTTSYRVRYENYASLYAPCVK